MKKINKVKMQRKILNNLFESFASAQLESIDYGNKVNEFINKKLNKKSHEHNIIRNK